ncbi:inorganic phosphate transporter [Marinilabilia rubra]|uniref:Phosphate transporter n=1 Tax=Marinilabilia rubra TaxID=2162893 RepID=A0A2U2B8X0_9BACT|nr:inorganic phosphate transporter [Marinilabilia rubra]PWD99505.1 phosphate/sulfate permease [Marinilabilia rubra]
MTFVWTIAIVLSLLAVLDLIVGVSNDAVNFLNSAIGSRVASRRTIYWIAGAGIILGAFFSTGMMEVARKGVIYPQNFYLTELMIIFLAVMIVDVILIDTYNTLGFPTSTTIAVVFELTGAALAIAAIKTNGPLSGKADLSDFINTGRVFLLFAGILVSIFLAFLSGALVQFISRVVFTFRYEGRFKLLFSIIGAFSIAAILFLILKKGLDASTLWDYPVFAWFREHAIAFFLIVFAATFFILFLMGYLFEMDIPRIVVLFGTFALALSFAANDLVNFIGIPLAGIESFKAYLTSGTSLSPDQYGLSFLSNDWLRDHGFKDGIYIGFFLISGIVMMLTIFFSRKARSVTETEVYLGRQSTGQEHFEPSQLSRTLVRNFLSGYRKTDKYLPGKLHRFISSRYKRPDFQESNKQVDEVIYFDTLRATVNLVVASVLISLGTYLGFPLSTTFVVFMVAMGTSLADQAWGRESAVYRISGVLSILGGWFITACLGFLGAFLLTLFIWWGTWLAMIVSLILMAIYLNQSTKYHKKRIAEKEQFKKEVYNEIAENIGWMKNAGSETIRRMMLESSKIYLLVVQGLLDEDETKLLEIKEKTEGLQSRINGAKTEFFRAMSKMPEESQDTGQFFIQALDYLTELGNTLSSMVNPVYSHIKNQHKGLTDYQREHLTTLLEDITSFFNFMVHVEKDKKFLMLPELIQRQEATFSVIESMRLNHIRKIRSGEGKTRINIIYMELLGETRNLITYSVNLVKSLRNFYQPGA